MVAVMFSSYHVLIPPHLHTLIPLFFSQDYPGVFDLMSRVRTFSSGAKSNSGDIFLVLARASTS